MKLWQGLLIAVLLMALPIVGACATEPQTPSGTTAPVDKPYLSSNEAIGIAKQNALTSERWYLVRAAKFGSNWSATYAGNSKWSVATYLYSEDGKPVIGRWTVFEKTLTAVYVGAFWGD